jgi:AAA domain
MTAPGTDLGPFAEGFNSWRKVLASVETPEDRWKIFQNTAHEVATYVSKGLPKTTAADELQSAAEANGLVELMGQDEVQAVIADAFAHVAEPEPDRVPPIDDDWQAPAWVRDDQPTPLSTGNGKTPPRSPILSKAEFLEGFVLPDYLVDGILQRRFIYALTGQTGHAKTAIALLIAQLVGARGPTKLGEHRVEQGRVVYLVGENADDVRMRVIGADAERRDDPAADQISFIPGVFNIGQMLTALACEVEKLGGADLIIVDTSAAYFLGQDENANQQIGAHARMLRKLTELPGGPCVLVLCHPIKHTTDPSQLLPRRCVSCGDGWQPHDMAAGRAC